MNELKGSDAKKFSAVANKESINELPDGNLGYLRLERLPEAFHDPVKNAAKGTIIPNVRGINARSICWQQEDYNV